MLKRREPTPEERRLSRLRRTWLSIFGVFLVATLLAVAWLGTALNQRQPVRYLEPEEPYDGLYVFRVDSLLLEGPGGLTAGQLESLRALRTSLGDYGVVYFWSQDGSGQPVRWLAFFPFTQPRRVYLERLEKVLEETDYFPSPGEDRLAEHIGVPVVRREGLILSSEREIPAYRLMRTPIPAFQRLEEAVFISETGFVPGILRKCLGMTDGADFDGSRVEAHWLEKGVEGERLLELQILPPSDSGRGIEVRTLPYCHPILPGAGQP